jgi:hypothetical protein
MSSTHVFTVQVSCTVSLTPPSSRERSVALIPPLLRTQDVCARLHLNVALETPVSSNSKDTGPKSGTGAPLVVSPAQARSDSKRDHPLQFSFVEACSSNQKVVAQSNWQFPARPTTPSPLPLDRDTVYGFWHTCASEEEEPGTVLSLESSFDGDIFGVGKRPVQREIEKDGCIRLVFVEE